MDDFMSDRIDSGGVVWTAFALGAFDVEAFHDPDAPSKNFTRDWWLSLPVAQEPQP